jgi:hypothetical protein
MRNAYGYWGTSAIARALVADSLKAIQAVLAGSLGQADLLDRRRHSSGPRGIRKLEPHEAAATILPISVTDLQRD